MAKGARASTRKRNNANLRVKVFDPVYDARTQRLSEKLQRLAAAPKPETEKTATVEEDAEAQDDAPIIADEDADVDMQEAAIAAAQVRPKRKKQSKGIKKRSSRTKPKHQVVFPSERARRKRQQQAKKG